MMSRRASALLRLVMRFLAFLIVIGVSQAPSLPAEASQATLVQSLASIALQKKKKKKKGKKKKGKKKKGKKKKKDKKKNLGVAVLGLEGDGGGEQMAEQILAGISKVPRCDAAAVTGSLGGSFSSDAIRSALGANGCGALVRGIGLKHENHVEVKVVAYGTDGLIHFAENYFSPAGDPNPLTLAPQIGDDLDSNLAQLDTLPILTNEDLAIASKPQSGFQLANKPAETSAFAATETKPDKTEQKPEKKSSTKRRRRDKGEEKSASFLSLGAGFDLMYWSYDLNSAALKSTINWNPAEPYVGASAAIETWPIEWVGAAVRVGFGMHSYIGDLPIDQDKISVTALEIDAALRGRYLLGLGIGFGGHLGYRFAATFTSAQAPTEIAPSIGAHLLSPGLDLYVTALEPWFSLRLSGDGIPWGMYSESPSTPGADASILGWHAEVAMRSTPFLGLYAELRGFYELYYVTYSGQGTRVNFDGTALTDSSIVTGLRGISIGLGWSF